MLQATWLTLTSTVVAGAIQEASLRGQIKATQEIIRVEIDLLKEAWSGNRRGRRHRKPRWHRRS
jgi:hypothetical protein